MKKVGECVGLLPAGENAPLMGNISFNSLQCIRVKPCRLQAHCWENSQGHSRHLGGVRLSLLQACCQSHQHYIILSASSGSVFCECWPWPLKRSSPYYCPQSLLSLITVNQGKRVKIREERRGSLRNIPSSRQRFYMVMYFSCEVFYLTFIK